MSDKLKIPATISKSQLCELIPSAYGGRRRTITRNKKQKQLTGISLSTLREYALMALRGHPEPLCAEYYIYWDRKIMLPRAIVIIILNHIGIETE